MREGGYDFFEAFDGADPQTVVGRREFSTVPPQALYLLNSPLVMDESQRAAERLLAREDLDDGERIDWAYRLALSRPPSETERTRALEFIERYGQMVGQEAQNIRDVSLESRTRFCQALIASAEFQILN